MLIIETENVSKGGGVHYLNSYRNSHPCADFAGFGSLPCLPVGPTRRSEYAHLLDLAVMVWVVYIEHHRRHGFLGLLLGLRVSAWAEAMLREWRGLIS